MKILFLIISIFFLTATNAFSGFFYHSDGPYRGKVIDLETGEPIEGAVVAAYWGLEFNPYTPFCDAKEAVTDKKGEFFLPKGSCFSLWPFTYIYSEVVVFKPGYLGYPPLGSTFEERKARMPGFTGYEFRDKKQYIIIKLGKPKTYEEITFTRNEAEGQFGFDQTYDKLPILLKLVNEERRNFSLKEIGRPLKLPLKLK